MPGRWGNLNDSLDGLSFSTATIDITANSWKGVPFGDSTISASSNGGYFLVIIKPIANTTDFFMALVRITTQQNTPVMNYTIVANDANGSLSLSSSSTALLYRMPYTGTCRVTVWKLSP